MFLQRQQWCVFAKKKPNLPDKTANSLSSTGGDMNAENTLLDKRSLHGSEAAKRSTSADLRAYNIIMSRSQPTDHPLPFYGRPATEISYCLVVPTVNTILY